MNSYVKAGDLAKVRKRHSDIPQDGLFDEPAKTKKPKRKASLKSVAYAPCPKCHAPGKPLTGLVAVDTTTVAFRDHSRRVGKVTMFCTGSGDVWDGERHDSPKARA